MHAMKEQVDNLLAAHMLRLGMPDVYDDHDKHARSEEPHPNEGIPLLPRADIGSTLALLTSQVQPPPYPAIGMGHDPQPRLQNSSHHCNVGAVPQQPPVSSLLCLAKSAASECLSTRHRCISCWPEPVACSMQSCQQPAL